MHDCYCTVPVLIFTSIGSSIWHSYSLFLKISASLTSSFSHKVSSCLCSWIICKYLSASPLKCCAMRDGMFPLLQSFPKATFSGRVSSTAVSTCLWPVLCCPALGLNALPDTQKAAELSSSRARHNSLNADVFLSICRAEKSSVSPETNTTHSTLHFQYVLSLRRSLQPGQTRAKSCPDYGGQHRPRTTVGGQKEQNMSPWQRSPEITVLGCSGRIQLVLSQIGDMLN